MGNLGVFYGVVQQGGHQRLVVETHFGQDAGNRNRMGNIGFATGAHLPFMGITRHLIGLLE